MMTFLREMESRAKEEKQAAAASMEALVAAVDKVGESSTATQEDVQMGEVSDAKTGSGGQVRSEIINNTPP